MSKLLELFSYNLKKYRLAKGFKTQDAFATASGISINIIKHAEAARGLPEYKNIQKLSELLGIDETQFFAPDQRDYLSETIEKIRREIRSLEALLAGRLIEKEDLAATRADLLKKDVDKRLKQLEKVIEQEQRTLSIRKQTLTKLQSKQSEYPIDLTIQEDKLDTFETPDDIIRYLKKQIQELEAKLVERTQAESKQTLQAVVSNAEVTAAIIKKLKKLRPAQQETLSSMMDKLLTKNQSKGKADKTG